MKVYELSEIAKKQSVCLNCGATAVLGITLVADCFEAELDSVITTSMISLCYNCQANLSDELDHVGAKLRLKR